MEYTINLRKRIGVPNRPSLLIYLSVSGTFSLNFVLTLLYSLNQKLSIEEEALVMSGLRRPNNGFQIVFGGFDTKDTLHRPIIEWYAINIEVPDPEEAEAYPSS